MLSRKKKNKIKNQAGIVSLLVGGGGGGGRSDPFEKSKVLQMSLKMNALIIHNVILSERDGCVISHPHPLSLSLIHSFLAPTLSLPPSLKYAQKGHLNFSTDVFIFFKSIFL